MIRIFSVLNTYLRMGYLLHLVTLAELLAIALLYYIWIENWSAFKIAFLSFMVSFPLFPQLDARSRFQNYKLAKDQLHMFGFQERIMKPFVKSRCQRDAVMRACKELGYETPCRNYFNKCGYRWYHLFPDIILKQPMVVFTKAFIKTTFFAKTYKPRFDYYKLSREQTLPVAQTISHRVIKKREKTTA